MSSLPSHFDAEKLEKKWYDHWLSQGYFESRPDERKPYTIVIPPPNVTGVLHMGHMLNNTIQDVLIRRARMQGYNACWVPGTDHASIATEAKVVEKLKKEGINKADLSREAFLQHAWDWKEKHGGIILQQLKELGASCDWTRTKFTMDPDLSDSVIKTFVDLYKKGLIYRGNRMVNWDPQAQTTVSDEEVIYKETQSKLYHLRYELVDREGFLVIATTRPETLLGDTAICVHPEDERYASLHGAKVKVPICGREIPIVPDAYVDREFGTGALKITPAHDPNDKVLGDKHGFEAINVLNLDGTLNHNGLHYQGMDRFEARKKIAKELEALNLIEKVEDYKNKVGTSERTGAVIEPMISLQWYLRMKDLAAPALEAVLDGSVQLIPEKFINTYKHWMENVHDWCISRQLWWGHRIPVWYYGEGENEWVVAHHAEEALQIVAEISEKKDWKISDLRQDEDALDTWFSSWLWPMSVFDGINQPNNPEIQYYYPTQVLVTAPEILFFWVARMIMAGLEYRQLPPFSHVYLTGIVRDKQGRKMSKSLGNSPDPIELMRQYGADGVRFGILSASPAGNDILFDEKMCEQGRNFSNKLWNALRLLHSWSEEECESTPAQAAAMDWFENRFQQALERLDSELDKFRLSEGLKELYSFVWDDFCSWYLEMIKPEYGHPISAKVKAQTIGFFERIVHLLHPYMPFLTEEIWHQLQSQNRDLVVSPWPNFEKYNASINSDFLLLQTLVSKLREIRNQLQKSPKETLEAVYELGGDMVAIIENHGRKQLIEKLANVRLNDEHFSTEGYQKTSFLVSTQKIHVLLPEGAINVEEELKKLEEELAYQKGFVASIDKKLSNEKFVSGAPAAVVDKEMKKREDGLQRIEALLSNIKNLKQS
jgi:valyl-tRNA synthetase